MVPERWLAVGAIMGGGLWSVAGRWLVILYNAL